MSDQNPIDSIEFIQGLKDSAAAMRTYYLALVDEGFTVEEALAFTGLWLQSIIKAGASGGAE